MYIPKMLVCRAADRWATQWSGTGSWMEGKQEKKANEGNSVAEVVLRSHYEEWAA